MKLGLYDLAICGGPVAFQKARKVGRPNTGARERFLARINEVLDREWLSNMGPLMYEFEARLAEIAGVRHCVSLCNATVALQMLMGDEATAGGPGDEVIVPALTFPATAHAVYWRGLRPVFADVDPVTGLIDPDHVESLITPRTRAIVGVQLWGQPCDVERLEKIAEGYRLRLYYDAAHALGCSHDGRPLGSYGHAEVFSFHATKIVNSFEGGAIVTDDDELAERMRAERNFGFGGPDGAVLLAGTNGKLSEAGAAMGLTSLEALDDTIAHNRANYEHYRRLLAGIPGVTTLVYDDLDRNNHHYMMVSVDAAVSGLHRDTLLTLLRAENVMAQPYFSRGLHQMKPYAQTPPVSLPNSEALCEQLLALPTGPAVDAGDVELISDVIRTAVAHGPELTARLATG
jgi:dTDP-4-amino-4,6-dideoxyglucose